MDRIESFAHDGLTFDVIDQGPLDGDVVVLLHGFPQRASTWAGVASRLNARGYRTIAPDQRGYSPRARPPRWRDYRITALVADVEALLERIGGPVHLVGHDWGAAVAWLVASRSPHVRTLTSVSVPHPAAFLVALASRDQLRRSWYMGFFQLPRLPERFVTRRPERFDGLLRGGGLTRDQVAQIRRDVVEYGAFGGGVNWYRGIPLSLTAAPRLWRARVAVPVTHVWSDRDVALSRRTADLTRRWATGPFRLEVLHGVSHWIPEQEPERLARVILDRVAAT